MLWNRKTGTFREDLIKGVFVVSVQSKRFLIVGPRPINCDY